MRNFIRNSIFFGIIFFQPAQSHEETATHNFADTIFILAAHATFHMSLALAHELGHILTAQLFMKCGATLVQDPQNTTDHHHGSYAPNMPQTTVKPTSVISITGEYPEFQSCWLNALVHVAGPVSGMAASYIALKTTNVIQEFNKKGNLSKAIRKGIKKPAFNEAQPSGIKGLAFTHILLNAFSLFPSSTNGFYSEGEKIRQCFFKK